MSVISVCGIQRSPFNRYVFVFLIQYQIFFGSPHAHIRIQITERKLSFLPVFSLVLKHYWQSLLEMFCVFFTILITALVPDGCEDKYPDLFFHTQHLVCLKKNLHWVVYVKMTAIKILRTNTPRARDPAEKHQCGVLIDLNAKSLESHFYCPAWMGRSPWVICGGTDPQAHFPSACHRASVPEGSSLSQFLLHCSVFHHPQLKAISVLWPVWEEAIPLHALSDWLTFMKGFTEQKLWFWPT